MLKRIVLCADDYGQAPGISEAILNLIQKDRITATSCLVTSPHWAADAIKLKPIKSKIDVGLHFNLTEGNPCSSEYKNVYGQEFKGLKSIIKRSLVRQLDKKIIAKELEAQIAAFVDQFDAVPNYIDGHQHIHQLPIIREAVATVCAKHLPKDTYVRLVATKINLDDLWRNFKKIIIYSLGTKGLKVQLDKFNIAHNQTFSGIYNFDDYANYPIYWEKFIKEVATGGLILCHPSTEKVEPNDPLANSRIAEYQYLLSDQFVALCAQNQVKLSRFND